MVPDNLKVLVLNQDYTPLNTVHWKKAVKRMFECPCTNCNERGFHLVNGEKKECKYCNGTGVLPPAIPVEYWDAGYSIRDSRGREHLVPAVLANSHHVRRKYRKVPFSKTNVLRRDGFCCQYCGVKLPQHELTIDHVVPRSMWNGGSTPTCWSNIVAACYRCNSKKADRTPEQAEMPLMKKVGENLVTYKKPKQPSYHEIALGLTYRVVPQEWEIYVRPFQKSSQF